MQTTCVNVLDRGAGDSITEPTCFGNDPDQHDVAQLCWRKLGRVDVELGGSGHDVVMETTKRVAVDVRTHG